jgi:hypothetical protein
MTKYSTASDQSRCGITETGPEAPAGTSGGELAQPASTSSAASHAIERAGLDGSDRAIVPWSIALGITGPVCCCCAAAKRREPPERCTVQRKKSTPNKPLLHVAALQHEGFAAVAFPAQKTV